MKSHQPTMWIFLTLSCTCTSNLFLLSQEKSCRHQKVACRNLLFQGWRSIEVCAFFDINSTYNSVDWGTVSRLLVLVVETVHMELRKCAEFFSSAEAQCAIRRDHIREGLRQFQDAEVIARLLNFNSGLNMLFRSCPLFSI